MRMVAKRTYEKLERATHDPLAHNIRFLLSRLKENVNTEIGKRYHFKDIDSIEKFKAAAPLSIYDDYSEAIDRMKKGESNLLTRKKPKCYAQTSGSVGNPKLIPVASEGVAIIMQYEFLAQHCLAPLYKSGGSGHGRRILIISYMDVKTLPCGLKAGDIGGMTAYKAKRIFNTMFTTPACSVFANQLHDFFYVHVRFALTERDLPCIGAEYMTEVFEFINYLIANKAILFDDIEKGTINGDIKMPAGIRAALLKRIRPQPELARELRGIFKTEDYRGILKKVWPKLTAISAIGSAAFQPYTERVQMYAGDEVAFFHLAYAASEGQLGVVTEVNSTKYVLLPHLMFYEFIPTAEMDKPDPQTLTLDQVELGQEYEIVITNFSGFYRYRINDVVKVVGFWNKTPQVCFSYRKNQLINMAAEKTTYAQLEAAVSECSKALGCPITEFAVFPDLRVGKGHYTLLIETENPALKRDPERVAEVLHQKLCEANPDISFAQDEGLLGMTEVVFLQPQTFALYRDLQVMRGASRNQAKPLRLIDTPEKERFFFALVDKE
jgi:hypothetical protein